MKIYFETAVLTFSILLIFLVGSCSTPTTHVPVSKLATSSPQADTVNYLPVLLDYYSGDFSQVDIPEMSKIKTEGKSSPPLKFPEAEIWESLFIVSMQKAPIQYVSMKKRLVFAPPYVFYLEVEDQITIYAYFMDHLYREMGTQINTEQKQLLLDTTLSQIVTQLQGSAKLKLGNRWSYLLK